MDNILVSVVIPTYNRERHLFRSIQSVLSQTYKNIEVIVVDDASEDNTEFLVQSILEGHPRVRYKRLSINSGVSSARNMGIEMARGEYIGFLDSDDEFLPNKIEKQVLELRDTEYGVGNVCNVKCLDERGKVLVNNFPIEPQKATLSEFYSKKVKWLTLAPLWNLRFIKKYNIRFNEEMRNSEDFDFILQILSVAPESISYTNEVLAINHVGKWEKIGNQGVRVEKISNYFFARLRLLRYLKENKKLSISATSLIVKTIIRIYLSGAKRDFLLYSKALVSAVKRFYAI